MNNVYDVELWNEPGEILRTNEAFVCEMSVQNHAFLSGIIKEKRPKKIVELGVAEGGTTQFLCRT